MNRPILYSIGIDLTAKCVIKDIVSGNTVTVEKNIITFKQDLKY